MFERGDSSNREKITGYSFQQLLRHIGVVFCLNTEKHFVLEIHFKANRKNTVSSKKMLGTSKIALRLRDWHVF